MRLVWYALGGGLGHLQRALAVLRHLRPALGEEAPLLLTSAAYAHLAIAEGLPCLRLPGAHEARSLPEGVAAGLAVAALRHLAPIDMLVVDTFADGLHGELTPEVLALAARRGLVARPGGAEPATSPAWPCYQRVFVPLPEAQGVPGEAVGHVLLRRPDEGLTREDARQRLGLPAGGDRPLVLAMHAGDPGEVAGLFDLVRAASAHLEVPHDLRFATPLPLGPWWEDARLVHPHPAAELFAAVDVLVAGGGYHSVAEARAFGLRTLHRPFKRSHDDQTGRLGVGDAVVAPGWPATRWAEALAELLAAPRPAPVPASDTDGARRLALSLQAWLVAAP